MALTIFHERFLTWISAVVGGCGIFSVGKTDDRLCYLFSLNVRVKLSVMLMHESSESQSPSSEAGPDDLLLYSSKCAQCSSLGKHGRCKYAAHLNAEPPLMKQSTQAC